MTSFRNGFVILWVILMNEDFGGDLITKWNFFLMPSSRLSAEVDFSPTMLAVTSMLQMLELKASLVPDMSSSSPTVSSVSSWLPVLALRMSLMASWLRWTRVLISWRPASCWYWP